MKSIADTIVRRIRAKGRGWVFAPKDFADICARATIDQNLSRLVKKGVIRRVDRGVYDYPKKHPSIGDLGPSLKDIVRVFASQSGQDVFFLSGAMAANALGLSTQVPAKFVYLTNGSTRSRKIAGRDITLKHATVPVSKSVSRKSNFVLQALFYLGRTRIDDKVVLQCAKQLDDSDIKDLKRVVSKIPGWMADTILQIQQSKYGHIR